jgi:endonuclease-3
MSDSRIRDIVRLLALEYGMPAWRPDGLPLSTLVQTILSQNTSDTNSGRAYRALVSAFPTWEDTLRADAADIARAIRPGGLADIKARRIKHALEDIVRKRGRLELDFLSGLPMDEAMAWLKQLPGVGDKTAACVLLFSLGRPALPVDTHVHRVAKRLGLVGNKTSAAEAHRVLQAAVPGDSTYPFHVLLIEHGRRTCKAQRPRCPQCVLKETCPSYDMFVEEYYAGIPRRHLLPG